MVITKSPTPSQPSFPKSSVIRRAWQFSPMLTLLVGANVLFFALALAGLIFDPRQVLGAPAWAKTLKFATSVMIYGTTLLWMLSYVKSRPRAAKVIAFATGVILMFEMVMIIMQAARGTAMHFNQSTPFDALVWNVMTVTIGVFYTFDIIGGILVVREKFANPVLGLGIKLGIIMALIGFGLGFLMTGPSSAQLAVLQGGGQIDFMGAHNVGALIDGQTRMLPVLGWNMDGGDLRIAHFIGIHGAQIIPLVAGLAMLLGTCGLSVSRQRVLVVIGAAFYFGLTMLVTWQALRNQSIVAPDGLTLSVVAALAAIAVIFARITLAPIFRQPKGAR